MDYRQQPYGNLVELNTCRELLEAIGEGTLADIANDYLDVLGSAAAIYEKNGDYALSLFSSPWCRCLNQASRTLCQTDDNAEALRSGRWHCHESCWNDASRVSIETSRPVDVPCRGGLRLYAVPILAGDEVVGSNEFRLRRSTGRPGSAPGDSRALRCGRGYARDAGTHYVCRLADHYPEGCQRHRARTQTTSRRGQAVRARSSSANEPKRRCARARCACAATSANASRLKSSVPAGWPASGRRVPGRKGRRPPGGHPAGNG